MFLRPWPKFKINITDSVLVTIGCLINWQFCLMCQIFACWCFASSCGCNLSPSNCCSYSNVCCISFHHEIWWLLQAASRHWTDRRIIGLLQICYSLSWICLGVREGPISCGIGSTRFLLRWCKRPLNQALVSFSLVCAYVSNFLARLFSPDSLALFSLIVSCL